MRRLTLAVALGFAALAPAPARSAGGHDRVGCIACHGVRKAEATSIFCLRCHAHQEQGGREILPIDAHLSHPYDLASVNARIAKVPPELIGPDGRFGCLSCHDPHPSNARWAYLRVETGPKGRFMEPFCAVCHPAKSGMEPGTLGGKPLRR